MIVDQAVYRDGLRLPCADLSDELNRLRAGSDGFLWIGLKDPTDAEFDLVKDELALHPLAVEDAVKGNQRAKLEVYDGSLFVVLKPLRYIDETSQVETGEVMIFLGDHFVVTVRRGEASPLAQVRRRLEGAAEHLLFGPSSVLHAVLDAVVDGYVAIDHELSTDVEQLEESVFSDDASGTTKGGEARQIYLLKREVLEVRRAVLPLKEAMLRIVQSSVPHVPDEARPFFRDVLDHLQRVGDHVETYDRLLADILSAHLTRVSVRQNDDMRRISAWVAMAAVPTMIAGIYGMNFDHMPELHWRIGYPLVLLLMVVICSSLYRMFKRSGWL